MTLEAEWEEMMKRSGLCQIREVNCDQRLDDPELFGLETEFHEASKIETTLLKDLHRVHHMLLKVCAAIDRLDAG